ncbi:MAG: diacylglycerol kinase family protein [Candidatus Nanopelagicales bacterium]
MKRQLAAIASLVAAIAAVVASAVTLWNHWDDLALALACLAVAVVAAWYVLSRAGVTRVVAAVVLVVAVGAAIAFLVGEHGVLMIVVVVALALATAGLARYALSVDAQSLRAAAPPGVPAAPAERPVLLYNPKSGGGKADPEFVAEAGRRGIRAVDLTQHDDLVQLAHSVIDDGADVVGVAGGDGSQALVAGVAAERDIPFVCIPAGTRNHFALDLGVDRDDVTGALDAFARGFERRVDLATVNDRVFVNNVSLGLYARIVQSDDYRDDKVGTAARMLPELLGNDYDPFDFRVHGPSGVDEAHPDLVLVSNNVYQLSGIGGFGTRARLDEGVLGVIVIDVHDARDLAELVALETAGRGSSFRGWHEWSDRSIVVDSGKPVEAGIDGEAVVLDAPVRFESRPGALRVRIAPHHPGLSPAAVAGTVRRGGPRRLLRVAFGRERASQPR